MITLRPYQSAAAAAALRIAESGAGGPVVLMFARQSGKNETSAYIERSLMLLRAGQRGGTGIKAAPTLKPQAEISRRRLLRSLRDAGISRLVRSSDNFIEVGRSRWGFFSAGKEAGVVGQTADIALECDEAQDVDADKWNKDFMPMAATTNAPAIYYGTPWTDSDLLAQAAAQAADVQTSSSPRLFIVKWDIVAELLPEYGRYVERERARLGANHPLFLTQYEMATIPGAGRLLSPAQLAAMRGQHARELTPSPNCHYVAGVDVAGEDSETPLRGRDSTVLTIARVIFPALSGQPPDAEIVQTYEWRGDPHEQLYAAIAAICKTWRARRVAVDTTAAGEALGLYLSHALTAEKVIRYRFTQVSKSALGFALQAAATTGRLTMFADDSHGADGDYAEAFRQLAACRAEYKPNRTVAWYVAAGDGHDDYVASIALANHAAEQSPPPAVARGRVPARS